MKKGSIAIILAIVLAIIIGTISFINYQKFILNPKTRQSNSQPVKAASEQPAQNKSEKIVEQKKIFFDLSFTPPKNWREMTPANEDSIGYLSPEAEFNSGNGASPSKGAALFLQKQTLQAFNCNEEALKDQNVHCIDINGKEFLNKKISDGSLGPGLGIQNLYIFQLKNSMYIVSLGSLDQSAVSDYQPAIENLLRTIEYL